LHDITNHALTKTHQMAELSIGLTYKKIQPLIFLEL